MAITIRIVIAPPNTTAGTVPIRRAVTPLSKAPISFEEPEAKCGVGISGRGRQASHRHSLLARARPRICLASVRPRTELDRGSAAAPSRYVRQRIGNPTQEQTPHDEKSCDRHHCQPLVPPVATEIVPKTSGPRIDDDFPQKA